MRIESFPGVVDLFIRLNTGHMPARPCEFLHRVFEYSYPVYSNTPAPLRAVSYAVPSKNLEKLWLINTAAWAPRPNGRLKVFSHKVQRRSASSGISSLEYRHCWRWPLPLLRPISRSPGATPSVELDRILHRRKPRWSGRTRLGNVGLLGHLYRRINEPAVERIFQLR